MKYSRIINEISSNNWAITENAFKGILSVIDDEFDSDDYKVFHLISESEQKALVGNLGAQVEDSKYSFIKGNVGILFINGPIIPRATYFSDISGITSIDRLTKEFLAFEENDKIEKIILLLDTPGGAITGVSEFAQLVNSSEKETISFVYGMAASAGYWIASAADKLYSVSTGIIGSIGVIFSTRISDDENIIEIVSSQSPYKRVDLKTKEGRKKVQVLLDDLANVFINDVAKYRSVSKETVLNKFGKGDVMTADKALKVNMVDSITTLNELINSERIKFGLKTIGESVRENALIDDRYITKVRKQDEKNKSSNERSIEKMSTLKELFADYPNLKDEVEAIKKESYDSGKKEIENRVAVAIPILESDSYPNSIKKVAVEVLGGKVNADVLKGSLIAYDAMKENQKVETAKKESEEVGDTDGSLDHESTSEDGTISNETEVEEAIAKLKAS